MLLSEFGGPVFRLSFDSSANSLIVFHTMNNLTLMFYLKILLFSIVRIPVWFF